ncbi:LTA synthase family protein [Flavobacterium cerinum]|uniref:Sulfatase-like hydrolase/transferase n=1 Tax=Flavobacterium cerinum TaxID=2502784 RepID=A0ABY5INW4_9FLAO|nr:alkaline phosphatase family protein [Flavobacterium cerinum]UUC44528.1 sulfatase-like hydrolase/transferase [Flavobacterium cerinum]
MISRLKKLSPFYNLLLFYIISSVILRIVLLFHPITQAKFNFLDIIKIFGVGFLSDVFVFVIISSFLWLYLSFLSNSKFNKPWGYLIFGALVALLAYVSFGNTILNEYGGVLPEIGISFVAVKTVLFGALLFLPKYRSKIRLALFSFTIFIFVLCIIQNTVSEFFFWNEFGVRYNFIAVDYLVYTNTVIGNIMESYPVVPLFTGIGIIALLATWYIVKKSKNYLDNLPTFKEKIVITIGYVALFGIALLAIPSLAKLENSQNVFANELEANGSYRFFLAFKNSELDYFKFYTSIPENEAFALLDKQIPELNGNTMDRQITGNGSEARKNVVLITVESLSADFMKAYGNEQNITPFLDSLASQSLFFTNLYATGNRTVRGLEAVTLSLPPTAGESVVKRKDNKNKFSTGHIFQQKGYDVKYLYGGEAYFDNMGDFFGGNNYAIVDKSVFTPQEITFQNIWGVCDEDLYKKAIQVMNKEGQSDKPFFNHIMTVSNHRPFTYPDNRIDIPSDSKQREGGVKYTDYSLRQFFKAAEKQAWFKNTVFVIVADHCASSAGKTELPLDKYRIPAMIYAPGFITPGQNNILMSQIDLMPTLMGLLNFNYKSKFFGQDVLRAGYSPRAFIATYQDLGYIKDNTLTILSPVKKAKQFSLTLQPAAVPNTIPIYYEQQPLSGKRQELINESIAYYQIASYYLKQKLYNNNN